MMMNNGAHRVWAPFLSEENCEMNIIQVEVLRSVLCMSLCLTDHCRDISFVMYNREAANPHSAFG